jgi:hypothetical protein
MALKPCKECGREISTEARTCPHCGKKNPTGQKTSLVAMGCLVLLVLLVIGVVTFSTGSRSSISTNQSHQARLAARPVVGSVTAMTLWRQYEANEVSADNYYKGRVFRVSGTVQSIDKDFLDNIVVRLESPNEFMSTSATIDGSGATRAAQLRKGDHVVLTCVVKGRIIGSPVLDDCVF